MAKIFSTSPALSPWTSRLALAAGLTCAIYGFFVGCFRWTKFDNNDAPGAWTLYGLGAGLIASLVVGRLLQSVSHAERKARAISAILLGIGFGALVFAFAAYYISESLGYTFNDSLVYLAMFVGGPVSGMMTALLYFSKHRLRPWLEIFTGMLVISLLVLFLAIRFGWLQPR